MSKICWVCKNTEDEYLKQKEEVLQSIEKELAEYENFEKSIVEITKEKLGFTDENKNKLREIKPEYTSMTINAVVENRNNFVKLEPNLSIVLDYYSKYGNRNSKSVKDVIDQYISEPLESRFSNELQQNKYKKDNLLKKKENLENVKSFFYEREITASGLDSSISQLEHNHLEYLRFSGDSYSQSIKRNNDFRFSFSQLGLNLTKKIYLCPVCLSLFLDSANASMNVMKGIQDAQRAADWDDDDDDWE